MSEGIVLSILAAVVGVGYFVMLLQNYDGVEDQIEGDEDER